MTFTIGVDPGINGAYAVLDDLGHLVSTNDLPTTGEGTKRMLSPQLFAAVIRYWSPASVIVERVGSMPGQGVSSMFRFGRAVGIIEGSICACGVSIEYVAPQVWKKHFGLPADKDASRQRAMNIWPSEADKNFKLVKDHGRAEAALIALWGVRAAKLAGAA